MYKQNIVRIQLLLDRAEFFNVMIMHVIMYDIYARGPNRGNDPLVQWFSGAMVTRCNDPLVY